MDDWDSSQRAEQVAQRLRAGDAAIVAEVLSEVGPNVALALGARFRATLSAEDIDDAIAEAAYRLWKYRDRFDPAKSSLPTWFYTLARSSAIDLLRRQQPWRLLDQEQAAEIPAREAPGPEEPRVSAVQRMLVELLHAMSPLDQQIMLASGAEEGERWAAQLSPEVGLSPGALRVRKLRLVNRLRQQLGARPKMQKSSQEEQTMETRPYIPAALRPVEQGESHGEPLSYLDAYTEELAALGRELDQLLKRLNKLPVENLKTIHARLWNKAVEDNSIADPRRRQFLEALGSWSSDAEATKKRHWEDATEALQRFKQTTEPPADEEVNRFEGVLIWLSQEMRGMLPRERNGESMTGILIHWDQPDFPITVEGNAQSTVAFRQLARNAVADADPDARVWSRSLGDFLVEEVRSGELDLAPLVRDDARSNDSTLCLVWNLEAKAIKPRKLPLEQLHVHELPTEAELDLWRDHPQLADHVDRAICFAAQLDHERPTIFLDLERGGAVNALVYKLASLTDRRPWEIAELVIHLLQRRSERSTEDAQARATALNELARRLEPTLMVDPPTVYEKSR